MARDQASITRKGQTSDRQAPSTADASCADEACLALVRLLARAAAREALAAVEAGESGSEITE